MESIKLTPQFICDTYFDYLLCGYDEEDFLSVVKDISHRDEITDEERDNINTIIDEMVFTIH